jgi:hypothetical protein
MSDDQHEFTREVSAPKRTLVHATVTGEWTVEELAKLRKSGPSIVTQQAQQNQAAYNDYAAQAVSDIRFGIEFDPREPEEKAAHANDGVVALKVGGSRAETGRMQFGNDWPGVFIRGDEALNYARTMRYLAEQIGAQDTSLMMGLVRLLESCRVAARSEGR